MKLTIEITPFGTKRIFEYKGQIFEEYERVNPTGSEIDGEDIETQIEKTKFFDELEDLINEGFCGDQFEIMMILEGIYNYENEFKNKK